MNLGACTIIRKIAEGGIADIYLAKALSASGKDKYLVCKCIKKSVAQDNEFLNSIIHEVQFSVQLRHPNILEIFDLCSVGDQPFLTMEYLDALDFHKLLRKNSEDGVRVPYDLAVYAIGQAALGLNAAHEMTDAKGNPLHLVHRDVSPENILFGSNGDIKLSDFGIAKTSSMPDITPPDTIKGKFNYMSPEHAWGDKLDRRSDLFSLAEILYEAVTGISFYPTTSVAEAMQCARMASYTAPAEVIPDFPEDLAKVLAKALDLDKNMRYPTVLEFRIALENCAQQHDWHATKEDWIAYLKERLEIQECTLPLMHAGEMSTNEFSIMKPEVTSLESAEDPYATGQILPDALAEILQNSEHIHTEEELIRVSSVALRRSGIFAGAVPLTPAVPEIEEEDDDDSRTVVCPAPDFKELMGQMQGSHETGDAEVPEGVDENSEFREDERLSSTEMLVSHTLMELPKTSVTRQTRLFILVVLIILILIIVIFRIIYE